jgi:hypothetical protein
MAMIAAAQLFNGLQNVMPASASAAAQYWAKRTESMKVISQTCPQRPCDRKIMSQRL